jgi:hypothetical protein
MQSKFPVSLVIKSNQVPFTVIVRVDFVKERTNILHFFVSSSHNCDKVVEENYVECEHMQLHDKHGLNAIFTIPYIVIKVNHVVEHFNQRSMNGLVVNGVVVLVLGSEQLCRDKQENSQNKEKTK